MSFNQQAQQFLDAIAKPEYPANEKTEQPGLYSLHYRRSLEHLQAAADDIIEILTRRTSDMQRLFSEATIGQIEHNFKTLLKTKPGRLEAIIDAVETFTPYLGGAESTIFIMTWLANPLLRLYEVGDMSGEPTGEPVTTPSITALAERLRANQPSEKEFDVLKRFVELASEDRFGKGGDRSPQWKALHLVVELAETRAVAPAAAPAAPAHALA